MENLEKLNKRLADYYGIDTESTNPIWRIVFSDDILEKRLTRHTKEGLELLTPMVVEVPKYRQWINPPSYILERLVAIPAIQQIELAEEKKSYEPIWVFRDHFGNNLPPRWNACELIIKTVLAAQGKDSLGKYKPKAEEMNDFEGQQLRVKKIEEELFGNETDTNTSLAHGEGIVVPNNYERNVS